MGMFRVNDLRSWADDPFEFGSKGVDAIALAPLPNSLLRYPVAISHYPCRVRARLDHSPDLRRRRRLLVKRNQHVASPS